MHIARVLREFPILLSASEVCAILEGRKTQLRRRCNLTASGHLKEPGGHRRWHPDDPDAVQACPFGTQGQRVWVRETHRQYADMQGFVSVYFKADGSAIRMLCSDGGDGDPIGLGKVVPANVRYPIGTVPKWTPSVQMPRWACRLVLEVLSVRVERVRAISEDDARAEGHSWSDGNPGRLGPTTLVVLAADEFGRAWADSDSASWKRNDLVWTVTFRPHLHGSSK
jgi:hypothetical protein